MNSNLLRRIQFSIFNLLLVACLGVLMRYKIGFEFPHFEQKHLQHAHSHFAFYGWIAHTLMSIMVSFLEQKASVNSKRYAMLINLNLLFAYGMFFSFIIWGYNVVSITFSTGAIIVSYLFTYQFVQDIKRNQVFAPSSKWFIAALLFNVMASFGTFALAIMMANKHIPQQLYLASVYFFLHFQYNGWFFFASMGFLQLFIQSTINQSINDQRIFWMFALSCVPAYLLSALWMNLPTGVYSIVVIASIVQFSAWILTLIQLKRFWKEIKLNLRPMMRDLLLIVAVAVTIKFSLQLGSVIPFISELAFGFRPIVIAYLHLVLLAIISLFLLLYIMQQKLVRVNAITIIGFVIFVCGIYLTEIILAIQGIAAFRYIMVPYTNEILFGLACLMMIGILLFYLTQLRKSKV